MTDETRKEQEKKDELTEKDLDQASGGAHKPAADRSYADRPMRDRQASEHNR